MGGVKKALLEVGGRPIVQRVVDTLSQVLSRIIIITNTPRDFAFLNLPTFRDLIPGCGSLGGLYTGLSACGGRSGLLVACDMPFLNAEIIRYMLELAHQADIVVPRIHGKLEPMHAIYSPSCIPHILELLTKSNLKILDFIESVDVLEIPETEIVRFDPELRFIMNVNSPSDLERARALAGDPSAPE
jgi:molybdopterin-guanine dinucleotide biosynthesis protein A